MPSTCDGVDADCDALVDNSLCNEVLLAHMDGTEGSSAFVDSSPWSHVLQVVGNVRISTATSRFGGASMHSSGGGENHVSAINSDDWQLGTGDFTLDAWVNIDVLPPRGDGNGYALVGRFAGAGDGWALFLMNADYANDGWAFLVNAGGQRAISVTQGILAQAPGVWTHVAVARQGTVIRLFVDGKVVSTVATSTAITDTTVPLLIGSDSGRGFRGYIDEVHLVKGAALWTADFTPPTAPYP
jgi:hypothetical protein